MRKRDGEEEEEGEALRQKRYPSFLPPSLVHSRSLLGCQRVEARREGGGGGRSCWQRPRGRREKKVAQRRDRVLARQGKSGGKKRGKRGALLRARNYILLVPR